MYGNTGYFLQSADERLDLSPELSRLLEILSKHPEGLSEYDLLKTLNGESPLRGVDELAMFQIHFRLFHDLYRLKRSLERNAMGSLEIHCMNIQLVPMRRSAHNPENLPEPPDLIADYYLDESVLERTTGAHVKSLMDWFWKRFNVHGMKEDALAVLDLHSTASQREIKSRYRELVLKHHPDLGGDAEEFHKIVEAMEILRLHEETPEL